MALRQPPALRPCDTLGGGRLVFTALPSQALQEVLLGTQTLWGFWQAAKAALQVMVSGGACKCPNCSDGEAHPN